MIGEIIRYSITPLMGAMIFLWGLYRECKRQKIYGKAGDLFTKTEDYYTLTGTVQNVIREHSTDSKGKTYYWYRPVVAFTDYDGCTWVRETKNRIEKFDSYKKGESVQIIVNKMGDANREIYISECKDDYDLKGNRVLCMFGILITIMGIIIALADKMGWNH